MIVPLAVLLVVAMVNAQASTTGTTAPAPTTAAATDASTAAATTAGGSTVAGTDAASTAAGDSSAAATTAAGDACADDACCKKIEDEEAPCSICSKKAGCVFYGLFNNNLFSAGGKCVATASASPGSTYKKITDPTTECADLCAKKECSDCIGDGGSNKGTTGCVWCDTLGAIGNAVGLNTTSGSCELKSCTSSVTPSTKCPSDASTVFVSAIAASVAAVFML